MLPFSVNNGLQTSAHSSNLEVSDLDKATGGFLVEPSRNLSTD